MFKRFIKLIIIVFSCFGVVKSISAFDVNSIDELKNCVNNQESCVLKSNIINDSDSLELTITRKLSFDLNGHSIENVNFVINGGDVLFKDSEKGGTITTKAKYAIYATDSILTIDNGIYNSNDTAIYSDKSKVVINNGKFKGKYDGMLFNRASDALIKNGEFVGSETKQYSVSVGLSTSSSKLIIEKGTFSGNNYGLYSSGCGNIQIKNGNYNGKDGGIWLSNSISCTNSDNYTHIEGGTFSGNDGARIQGRNTNIISGGTYNGNRIGLYIQCANPIHETCKDSVLLKGGTYKSFNNSSEWPFFASAIFMNSDHNAPLKISDLLDKGYKLSDENLLEKDGGDYGYYSYTKSLDMSIYNPNISGNSASQKNDDNEKTIVKVPNTMLSISNINVIVGLLFAIAGLLIIIFMKVKKRNGDNKNEK